MKKIFTYRARQTTYGTVSIEAESLAEADAIREQLNDNDCTVLNIEVGSGDVFIDATGHEDTDADDGNHYFTTPRANAIENAAALEEIEV